MTKERAIQILEKRSCCRECVVINCTCAECDEAFDMAFKVLKQEPILDKIRAEIERKLNAHGTVSLYNKAINDVLEILDKYKAESEK